MSFADFLLATKIVLSGFVIYRIQRFLRIHRSWEVGFILIAFSFLMLCLNGSPVIEKWVPIALLAFLVLITLEREIAFLVKLIFKRLSPNSVNQQGNLIAEIAQSACALAATKTGALLAFERRDSLLKFGDSGIEINADIKKELLGTLFTKDTPTHDGGVLIRKGKATHCGAVFPLTERKQLDGLGTRHRAALGLTEKTDAVCLVISEEEGTISLAKEGELIYAIPPNQLEDKIKKALSGTPRSYYYPIHYMKRLSPKMEQSNFLKLSKSLNQKIYDVICVLFWICVIMVGYQLGILRSNLFQNATHTLFVAPWLFIPTVMLAISILDLFLIQSVTMDGNLNKVVYETKLIVLPLFRRRVSRDHLTAVLVKPEGSGGKLLSLQFLNKKRKALFIDRTTATRSLFDSAKKIRDVMNLELIS